MKKTILKLSILAVLFMLSISFASCENEEIPEDNINYIIQDETTWNEAFEKLEFDNFSMKGTQYDEEYEFYVCETRIYGKANQDNRMGEIYVVLDEKGETHQYESLIYYESDSFRVENKIFSTLEEALKNRVWILRNDDATFDNIVKSIVLKFSFSEKFQFFTYSEEAKCYSYEGRIAAKFYSAYDDTQFSDVYCINPSIQFKDGKIVFLSTQFSFSENGEPDRKLTYFDLGTTTVTIPEEVIAGAKQE